MLLQRPRSPLNECRELAFDLDEKPGDPHIGEAKRKDDCVTGMGIRVVERGSRPVGETQPIVAAAGCITLITSTPTTYRGNSIPQR